jgi:hypothetical protein
MNYVLHKRAEVEEIRGNASPALFDELANGSPALVQPLNLPGSGLGVLTLSQAIPAGFEHSLEMSSVKTLPGPL